MWIVFSFEHKPVCNTFEFFTSVHRGLMFRMCTTLTVQIPKLWNLVWDSVFSFLGLDLCILRSLDFLSQFDIFAL